MFRLRVGLVGFGRMGASHARILQEMPGIELVGIADPRTNGETDVGVPLVPQVESLVSLGLDYAVVSTPSITHVEVATVLAREGIPTLIEKPLAPTLAGAEAIREAFLKSQTLAAVGHIERFNASIREARKRIDSGQLGEIFQITTSRQGPFPGRIADVGVVLDLATHDLDVASWLSGSKYAQVGAVMSHLSGRDHEDLVLINAKTKSQVCVSHTVNWLSPFRERRVVITGERGAFVADTLEAELTFFRNGERVESWLEGPSFLNVQVGEVTRYAFARPEPLKSEHEAFRDAVLGKCDGTVSLLDGCEAIRLAESVIEAAERGSVIDV